MLSVLGLGVELFSDNALSQPIAGDGNPAMETFVVQSGQDFFARITAEDLLPSMTSPGIVGLNLDVSWNRDEFGASGGDFMRVSDPPGNFGNPLPAGSPAVTAALPENRQGVLDNPLGTVDFLGGNIAPAGMPIGIGVAETFSQIGFALSDLGVLSTVLTVDLEYCDFADGSAMASGDIAPYSVTIRMNQPPLAVAHSETSDEDAAWPLAGNVLTGCSDPEGTLLVVDAFPNPSTLGADVDIDPAGNYTYTPTPGMIEAWQHLAVSESVTDTFTYDILDEDGGHATGTVTVLIEGVNDAPVAIPDPATTTEDDSLTIDVLDNDTDVDTGHTLSVLSFDATSVLGATITLAPDGSLIYDPTGAADLQALPVGAFDVDTFTYTIQDEHGEPSLDSATVTITVTGVNDAPVAIPDIGTTTEDDPLTIDVLDNDTDVDTGHVLSLLSFDLTSQHQATITRDPGNSNAVIYNPLGKYRYDAAGNRIYDAAASDFLQLLSSSDSVTDTFSYTVEDEHHATATATVSVTVTGLNDPALVVVKWEDLDGNHIQDANESSLDGWEIFLDLNLNGVLDASIEPFGQTDASGQILFEYMLPTQYDIYEIIPDPALGNRWAQTTPGTPAAPLPYVRYLMERENAFDPPTQVSFGNRESLHITDSSILQNDVIPAGNGFMTITFNRNLARQDWSDPAVWGHYFQLDSLIRGQDQPIQDYIKSVGLASGGDQNPSTLTIRFANLPDDSYTLTLKSGIGGFEDTFGNLLDGERGTPSTVPSGDALDGGDFRLHFVADLDATSYLSNVRSQFPFSPGATFEYLETQNNGPAHPFSWEISNQTVDFNGQQCMQWNVYRNNNLESANYLTSDENTIWAHGSYGPAGPGVDEHFSDPPLLIYQFDSQPGTVYENTTSIRGREPWLFGGQEWTGTRTLVHSLVGNNPETITVPAGTFSAWQVYMIIDDVRTSQGQTTEYHERTTYWLVYDTGIVAAESTFWWEGDYQEGPSTNHTKLQSYDIPQGTFNPVDPLGSMIYVPQTGVERGAAHHIDPADGTALGYIGPSAAPYTYNPNLTIPADDIDSYVVSLDDNQTLTIIVEPLEPNYTDPEDPYSHDPHSPMLSPAIGLKDPNGTLMATLPTTGIDPHRLIQTAAIDAAGDYTITVSGLDSTLGAYRLIVTLNAAVEEESLARGDNDTQAQAQDIDPSFIRLFDQILLIPQTGDLVQDSLAATSYIRPEAVSDQQPSDALSPRNHAILNGVLYYAAADTTGTSGAELWSYNGQNHVMVADINPGAVGSYPSHFAVFNDNLYFSAYDSEFGYELWKFDGDTVTRMTDINPGQGSARPMYLTVYNGRLYFSADDGEHGSELWKYVPAAASIGTASMVEDYNKGEFGSLPGPMTVFDEKLYFSADEGVHDELNNDNIHGFELCVFDAFDNSQNGIKIKRVHDINPDMPSSHVQDIVVFGDGMFFRANDGTNGWEAFKLDKLGKLKMLPDLNSDADGSWPGYFTVFRNRLFVVADIEDHGWQLLEYDGNQFNQAEGTGPGTIVLPDSPTVVGQYMFFSAQSAQHGRELWAYDGFETFLVDDFTPGTASTFDNSSPYRGFATLGEELFFRTFDYSGMLRYVPPVATAQYHETTSTRGAVVGTIGDGDEKDWYSFTLEDGQTATVALDFEQSAGAMSFAIYRDTTQLEAGIGGIDNLQLMVDNILDDTTNGTPDTYHIVVNGDAPNSNYRLVITRDATFDAEPNDDAPSDSIDKAQTLPPTGVALGFLQADEFDYYKFEAVRGDTILVETSTPADGPGQFINTLDPTVELLDPETGQWIAGDNNSPDGRNAWVRLRSLSDGTYTVRVSSSGGTAGEYVLNVRLNPDAAPKPLYVTTTTMPADEAITSGSAVYDLDHDGRVGLGDLALLASVYQQSVGDGSQELVGRCDFDGSGNVALGDLALFAQSYNLDVLQISAAVQAPQTLETEQLRPVVAEAVARMADATGIAASEIVTGVTISIVDLPGNLIGRTVGRSIEIDTNAAANGWFVDQTPADDVEFAFEVAAAQRGSLPAGEATDRADLLTTVMHELGHVLGLASTEEHGLMNVLLPLGTRRLLHDAWMEEPAAGNDQSTEQNGLSDELLDELFAEIGQD